MNRGRINPEVKKRIESIAAKLNYRKNKVAKSLANRKLNLKIAVVLHIHSNEFFSEVLQGIERARMEIVDFVPPPAALTGNARPSILWRLTAVYTPVIFMRWMIITRGI
jgi:hypothetical protein